MSEHLEGKFFTKGVNFGRGKSKEEEKLCALVQAVMLFERKALDSVTLKNCKEIKKQIVDNYSSEEQRKLWDVMDYLADAGFNAHSFLTAENVPFVIVCARWALEKDESSASFHGLVDQWQKEQKNIAKLNPQDKMQYLEKSMKKYYK